MSDGDFMDKVEIIQEMRSLQSSSYFREVSYFGLSDEVYHVDGGWKFRTRKHPSCTEKIKRLGLKRVNPYEGKVGRRVCR